MTKTTMETRESVLKVTDRQLQLLQISLGSRLNKLEKRLIEKNGSCLWMVEEQIQEMKNLRDKISNA